MRRDRGDWLKGWPFLVLALVLFYVAVWMGAFR